MMNMRGQAAVEFLAIVAFFLLVTVPVFMYFYTSAPQKEYYASLSQAESAASEFIKYGELVGTQSNGTKVSRLIVLPKHAMGVVLNGTTASLNVSYYTFSSDVVKVGAVDFVESGIDVPFGGTYEFIFTNVGGKVNVTRRQ